MSDATQSLLPGVADPAAPDGGTPAVPAAPNAGAPAAPASSGSPAAWTEGLDDDAKKFIEAKGFKSPADALKVLRESAPPETPDAYQLPVPDGEDPAFAKSVAPLMHAAGLSAAQATKLAEGWNQMQAAARAQAAQAEEAAVREANALNERQEAELRREWAEAFDANSEYARRAVAQFIPGDAAAKQKAVEALEGALGYSGVMKMWAGIGALIKEGTAHGMGQGRSTAQGSFYENSNMQR
jgi:hypothetical protein